MNALDPQELRSFLVQMRHEDPDFRVFGASGHQYQLHPPLSEAAIRMVEMQYGITLPDEYRHFLSVIGNGGAGPYYGILPLAATTEFCDPRHPFPFRGKTRPRYQAVERWAANHEPGVLSIAERGCMLYSYLVVHGPNYGTVWNGVDALHLAATSFTTWYLEWVAQMKTYALPALERERVTQRVEQGMTKDDVIRLCGGPWRRRKHDARTFLSFRHLHTQFELDQDSKVIGILPGSIIPRYE
ncbi:MAG: SMI1/KNR4 family protein [Chloroflexota bacterium]|nr:SMI1/KNR4 family protein [Chloroflexota bacterium]